MTSPRDARERVDLEDLIGAVAREMTRGEPSGELLLRVRDRLDGPRPARHWVWQTAAVGVLLLVVLVGTRLRIHEDRPAEPIATGLRSPRPAPPSAQPPPSSPPAAERRLERFRPTAPAGAAIRSPSPALAAQPDLPAAAGLPGLPLPEPLVVSISPPVELEVPAEIVLTSIAVEGLAVPPLNSRKESR